MASDKKQERRIARREARIAQNKACKEERRRREEEFKQLPGRLKKLKYWRKYRRHLPVSTIRSKPIPLSDHRGSLSVIFISASDYAFMGYTLARCLNSIGVKSVATVRRYSPLRSSSQQGRLCSDKELARLAKEAYVIVWMHSVYRSLPQDVTAGKKLVVFHGGTRYRRKYQSINKQFNPIVHLSLVQTGELLNLGAVNEHWLLPPVDTKGLKPDFGFHNNEKLTIGHFSSHPKKPKTKGTNLIRKIMSELKASKWGDHFTFKTSNQPQLISWRENMNRMAKCDIYIESLSQGELHNKNRHDWSVQALEACALGCITITNFTFASRYRREYGKCGLFVTNNGAELKKILIKLFQMDRDQLLELKQESRRWAEESHSYEVIGKRLQKILGV